MRDRESRREHRDRRRTGSRLVFGAILMVVGGLLIADNLGLGVPRDVWSYWPFLLIALGAARLALEEERGAAPGTGCW